jgi:GNAT superfamily N-acetyltransferase
LNDFLKRYARQNDERGLGRTFVAVLPDDPRIYGYYTLASGALQPETVPEKLPRYPTPIIHLGRLAVDTSSKGQGLGRILLLDALNLALQTSERLGVYAVEVYALNETARAFYLKYGFAPLLDGDLHLYLTMRAIRMLGLGV